MMIRHQYSLGICLKILNGICFVVVSLMLNSLYHDFSHIQILFLLLLFDSVNLFTIQLFRSTFLNVSLYYCLLRAILTIIGMCCWLEAIEHLGLSESTAIGYLSPIFAMILAAIIAKEKVPRFCYIWGGVICIALIILANPTGNFSGYGVLAGLGSAISWSLYDVICRMQSSKDDHIAQAMWTLFISAIIAAPITYYIWTPISINQCIWIFVSSIISSFNVVILFLAYRKAPIGVLAPFSYLKFVFSVILSFFVLNRYPSISSIIATLLILITSFYINYLLSKG